MGVAHRQGSNLAYASDACGRLVATVFQQVVDRGDCTPTAEVGLIERQAHFRPLHMRGVQVAAER